MFKRYLRWIVPLIALVTLVTCMAFATLAYTHAAAPAIHTPSNTVTQPHTVTPQSTTTTTPSIIKYGF